MALHRHAEQADELKALDSIPILGDLLELNVNALAQLMAGCDVASTSVEIIEHPEVKRVIIELTQGNMPVGQAIQRLARV